MHDKAFRLGSKAWPLVKKGYDRFELIPRMLRGKANPLTATDLTIRKTFQGALSISAIVGGYLVTRQYMGYTKREAIAMFRSYIKTMKRNPLTRQETAFLLRESLRHARRARGGVPGARYTRPQRTFFSGVAAGLNRAAFQFAPATATSAVRRVSLRTPLPHFIQNSSRVAPRTIWGTKGLTDDEWALYQDWLSETRGKGMTPLAKLPQAFHRPLHGRDIGAAFVKAMASGTYRPRPTRRGVLDVARSATGLVTPDPFDPWRASMRTKGFAANPPVSGHYGVPLDRLPLRVRRHPHFAPAMKIATRFHHGSRPTRAVPYRLEDGQKGTRTMVLWAEGYAPDTTYALPDWSNKKKHGRKYVHEFSRWPLRARTADGRTEITLPASHHVNKDGWLDK
jgi:hypothetical protein